MMSSEEQQHWFDPSPFIEGSHKLIEIVGEWPSFDDAEVYSLVLDRRDGAPWNSESDSPTLDLKMRLAETGYFLVEIRFKNVFNVGLTNFRYQNSIQEIVFDRLLEQRDSVGNYSPAGVSAEIIAHCGLQGKFAFQSAIIGSVAPCNRDGTPRG
jgi:hypothetical protein